MDTPGLSLAGLGQRAALLELQLVDHQFTIGLDDVGGLLLLGGAGLVGLDHGRHAGATRRCRRLMACLSLHLQPALELGQVLCQLMELLHPRLQLHTFLVSA